MRCVVCFMFVCLRLLRCCARCCFFVDARRGYPPKSLASIGAIMVRKSTPNSIDTYAVRKACFKGWLACAALPEAGVRSGRRYCGCGDGACGGVFEPGQDTSKVAGLWAHRTTVPVHRFSRTPPGAINDQWFVSAIAVAINTPAMMMAPATMMAAACWFIPLLPRRTC
jgi:hypothetical protein